jgi:isoleucyl-tRNA synthetase
VRQPLAEVAFSVGNVDERRAILDHADIVADELNVKRVRLLDAATEAVSHMVKPLPKQLGQKYGNKFPSIAKAIQAMNTEEVSRVLMSGSPLKVTADGVDYEVLSDEVDVKAMAKEGFAVAEDGPYVAALVTELTPDLVKEGMAREFVRRVQDLRKQADLNVADRIRLYVDASPKLKEAVLAHKDYITAETLTLELFFSEPPATATVTNDSFDGETVTVGLVQARFAM